MKYIILFLKGMIIGVTKIIPGVSGAVMAISLGVYEKALNSISNFFSDIKNNLEFLVPIGLGVAIAIVLSSKIVIYFLDNYYLPTMLLFVGLIIGGIPQLLTKINFKELNYKSYMAFIGAVALILLLQLVGNQNSFIEFNSYISKFFVFIFIGLLDALTMIIPGISGTAIMMILGCYHLLLNALSSLTSLSEILNGLEMLIPFFVGIAIGVISLSKLMSYLLNKKTQITYSAIIGFAIASVITLIFQVFQTEFLFYEVLISLGLLVIGILISVKISD